MKRAPEPLGARLRRKRAKLRLSRATKKNRHNCDDFVKYLNPETHYGTMYPREKGKKMIEWWNNLDALNKSLITVSLMWIVMAIIGWIYQKVVK